MLGSAKKCLKYILIDKHHVAKWFVLACYIHVHAFFKILQFKIISSVKVKRMERKKTFDNNKISHRSNTHYFYSCRNLGNILFTLITPRTSTSVCLGPPDPGSKNYCSGLCKSHRMQCTHSSISLYVSILNLQNFDFRLFWELVQEEQPLSKTDGRSVSNSAERDRDPEVIFVCILYLWKYM